MLSRWADGLLFNCCYSFLRPRHDYSKRYESNVTQACWRDYCRTCISLWNSEQDRAHKIKFAEIPDMEGLLLLPNPRKGLAYTDGPCRFDYSRLSLSGTGIIDTVGNEAYREIISEFNNSRLAWELSVHPNFNHEEWHTCGECQGEQ